MEHIINLLTNIRIRDIIDILIVSMAIYKFYTLIRETRAEQLIKGIGFLLILTKISEWLELFTINWLLSNAMTLGTIALLIVFQPELRRGLEYIGRNKLLSRSFVETKNEYSLQTINEIITAIASLSRQKIGSLIVIERNTGLNDIADTGVKIGGAVSSDLLINIFIPNTPLHDGAVIIKENNIKAASCFLPLTERSISKDLGTRHRAALGLSEKSDSLSIVVSEETGSISVADNGEIARHIDIKTLEEILLKIYNPRLKEDSAIGKIKETTKWR